MAVHHELLERLVPVEKIVTNPEQIILRLLVDWNVGANARVDKEKIATTVRQFEFLQKIDMLSRKNVREFVRQPDLLVAIRIYARLKAVRQQRFQAAVLPPFIQASWISEETWQVRFMVPAQKDCFVSLLPLQ